VGETKKGAKRPDQGRNVLETKRQKAKYRDIKQPILVC